MAVGRSVRGNKGRPFRLAILRADYKQLLDEVFVMSGIIKIEVRLRLITLTETLIIPDITKTESNNCFIIHCFEEKTYLLTFLPLTFLLRCPRT